MEFLEKLLNYQILDNTGLDWLMAAAIAVLAMLVLFAARPVLRSRVKRIAGRTSTFWDDAVLEMLASTKALALIVIALMLGSLALTLPEGARNVAVKVTVITLIIQAGLWASHLLKFWLAQEIAERRADDPGSVGALNVGSWVGRVILWSVVLLVLLDNLGIDVTALVAGLGIGGVAVALAMQNILGDLFASLSIVLDKPFVIGDFLIVGDHLGSVEHLGLKTTRLRSLSGEQLVMSNADLLNSRLRNYGRMYERRVAFDLGVTYQTPREKLKMIPGMIEKAVKAQGRTRFDRSHFKAYGDFSLIFENVYYVLGPDYNIYMDIQHEINLAIHEAFEAEGIEFAYPTQTLFLEGLGSESS